MNRFKIFLIMGIFFVIFFLSIFFIAANPDYLKPIIIAQFKKYTACDMRIDDHLSFSFFPYFGVKAKHILIFTPTIKIDIKNAVAKLDLLEFNFPCHLQIKNIQTSKINIENMNARLFFKNNILNIESIQANVYGGSLNGKANVNFNAYDHPVMIAHIDAFNVQIEPLFKLIQATDANIYPDTRLSGTGNIELDVSTAGMDAKSLLNNLNGTAHFDIRNGFFMGKDWDDIVAIFVASNHLIASETILSYFRIFQFRQLTASFKINNGIFFNDDLWIDSSELRIKGKGQINLLNNFIEYTLQAEFQNAWAYNNGDNNSGKEILATISVKS